MFVFDLPVSIVTFVVEYYGKLQKHGGINQFEVSHVFLHIFGPLKESSSRIYFRVPKTFEVPCLKNPHVRVLGFRVNVSFSCFILMVNWLPSLKLTASLPLKMDGWKTSLSFCAPTHFQGRLLLVSGRVTFSVDPRISRKTLPEGIFRLLSLCFFPQPSKGGRLFVTEQKSYEIPVAWRWVLKHKNYLVISLVTAQMHENFWCQSSNITCQASAREPGCVAIIAECQHGSCEYCSWTKPTGKIRLHFGRF